MSKQKSDYWADYFSLLPLFPLQEMLLISKTPDCCLTPGDINFNEMTFKEKLVTRQD